MSEQAHVPCPCGKSSDAYAIYDSGWGHCFSCGENHKVNEGEIVDAAPTERRVRDLVPFGEIIPLESRGLTQETCQKFGYFVTHWKDKAAQVAPYHDENGKLIGQKVRFPGKDFTTTGDMKSAVLFGQHLWRRGGKRIVITEGEIDAMSLAQATNLTWPVVSLPNGAQSAKKAIQRSIEYLESFDLIVLMFDMDEPGQKAVAECIELFQPGKVAVAVLPLKDANEMVKAGRVKELVTAMWDAQVRRPDGIVNGSDLWDVVSRKVEMGSAYPFAGLNRILYGKRPAELVTWCAGSGIGKSAFTAEIAYHDAMIHKEPVGYVALEEDKGRSALRFMGLHIDKPLHLPIAEVTEEERKRAFAETLGTGRFWLYDHFGSIDSDNLLSKLRYMVKGLGIKSLFLDHLSIVVSGMDLDGDERRMIDKTMTDLRSFVQETGAGLQLVSHLKRPDGRGHEEGAITSLAQLRGSAAIAQLSDAVIGLERNQQHEDPRMRNVTIVRVLKNRYAGVTGIASAVEYSNETGRLREVDFMIGQDGEIVLDPARDAFAKADKSLVEAALGF